MVLTFDLDGVGLGLFGLGHLGQVQGQHAVLEGRGDVLLPDALHVEGPAHAAAAALAVDVLALLVLLLVVLVIVGGDGQQAKDFIKRWRLLY